MYKTLLRPLLFSFDPEKVHYFTFSLIKLAHLIGLGGLFRSLYQIKHPALERELFGLKFSNPVGLAAGFDKNAVLYNELANFGFGFIEIGTTTPIGQEGNPKKRLFRLKDDKGIINRMGFNNKGLDTAITELKNNKGRLIIGGNIGKNTQTLPEHYTQDYLTCFNALHPYVDYFVLNVSCPNVGSHAKLNDKAYLEELIGAVQQANKNFAVQKPFIIENSPRFKYHTVRRNCEPLFCKPNSMVLLQVIPLQIERVFLSLKKELQQIGTGGLSGQPIKDRSTAVIKHLSQKSNKAFPIIGVGGIHSPEDALEKINAGADLLQIYTGFIYEGPRLIKNINKAIISQTA